MNASPQALGSAWKGREIDPAQFSRAWFDLPYGKHPSQKLDVILPDEGEGPFPVIFYIPGGGWISGDKRSSTMACLFKAVSQGYAVVAANYRYGTESPWPAQLYDVKTALRMVRSRSDEFQLDPDSVIAWGNSAGGHIASMLAATGGRQILEDRSLGYEDVSCAIQALISWYAPSDLLALDMVEHPQGWEVPLEPVRTPGSDSRESCEHGMDSILACLLGFAPTRHPAASAMASPRHFIDEDFPPALFQHGRDDDAIPYEQSVLMADEVNRLCGESRAVAELFPGGHGSELIKADENINRCLDFIESVLGRRPRERGPLSEVTLC